MLFLKINIFTFIIISSIFIFTRWRRIEYYLDEWKPDDINPIGLISLHATVIIGVLFFLNVAMSGNFQVNGIDELKLSPEEVRKWIIGLTSSVVIQFSIAAICVAIIGNPTKEKEHDSPSGYKIGLLFTFPGFMVFLFLLVLLLFFTHFPLSPIKKLIISLT